jgi:hypothetical protein
MKSKSHQDELTESAFLIISIQCIGRNISIELICFGEGNVQNEFIGHFINQFSAFKSIISWPYPSEPELFNSQTSYPPLLRQLWRSPLSRIRRIGGVFQPSIAQHAQQLWPRSTEITEMLKNGDLSMTISDLNSEFFLSVVHSCHKLTNFS